MYYFKEYGILNLELTFTGDSNNTEDVICFFKRDKKLTIEKILEICIALFLVPFSLSSDEINDISLFFDNRKILHATFSASCIVDYKKNACTTEIAYNGKTIDIVHISLSGFEITELADGSLIKVDLEKLRPYLDNDEVYFVWRMPHKSLDRIFKSRVDVGNALEHLRDLITSPVVSEKYGYSVRINESRLLPEEITRIGAFHRQKLKKLL